MKKLMKIILSQFDPKSSYGKDLGSGVMSSVLKNRPSLTPVPQDLMTSILHRYQAHTWCTDVHAGKTPASNKVNKSKSTKEFKEKEDLTIKRISLFHGADSMEKKVLYLFLNLMEEDYVRTL